MNRKILFRIFITWLLFLPVPIINGILRESWYKEITGPLLAGQIGCLILSLVFLIYAFVSLNKSIANLKKSDCYLIGFIWLMLTLVFEFSLGLAGGRSWSYMLSDYKIWEGKMWPVVLLTVFFSPVIIKRIFKK